MRRFHLSVTVLAAALFALPSAATAQANKAQVYHFEPMAGAEADFEAALQSHAEWREQNEDPWHWDVYQVVQGKHAGSFVVRSGGHTWAEFDDYGQGFGAEGQEHFAANVGPMVASTKAYVEAVDTALVRWPDDTAHAPLIEVTDYELKPGSGSDWYDVAEKFHEAIVQEDATGYYHAIAYPEAGASGYARLVNPHSSWADFEDPERSFMDIMHAVYGEEETEAMGEKFTSSYSDTRSMVLRYRPDLSVAGSEGM